MPQIDFKLLFPLKDIMKKNYTYAVYFLSFLFLSVHYLLDLKVEHQTKVKQFVCPPFN